MLIGAHVSIAGGIEKAPGRGEEIGCDSIQIFSKNQMQWKAREIPEEEAEAFQENLEDSRVEKAAIHDSYLINLCNSDEEGLEKSKDAFVEEMERAQLLGGLPLIFHPGSHKGEGPEWALGEVSESIDECVERAEAPDVRLLLETTAGQGTNLGHTFEEVRDMLEGCEHSDRVGVCFDTAHVFESGYDLRDGGMEEVLEEFDEVVGLENLEAFHCNDSKTELGSEVDRHEHVGEGEIGEGAFRHLVNDERFEEVPLMLETPGEAEDFERNIELLRGLEE